jgi:hypothetical protein
MYRITLVVNIIVGIVQYLLKLTRAKAGRSLDLCSGTSASETGSGGCFSTLGLIERSTKEFMDVAHQAGLHACFFDFPVCDKQAFFEQKI